MAKALDFTKTGRIDKEKVGNIQADMIPDVLTTGEHSIYHYTSIAGLQGVLRGKLWFTHIGYMNDRDEVIVGAEDLRDYGLKHCSDEFAETIVAEAEENKKLAAFVCCFSLERDSLAMWNYYTKDLNNQGYNLVFDYKDLVISILQNNPELHGCKFSFGKVDYCNSEETYIRLAHKQAIRNISDALTALTEMLQGREIRKQNVASEQQYPSVIKYYGDEPKFRRSISTDTIFFMKRPCFSIEKEFRIVIQAPEAVLNNLKRTENGACKYKYRISNGLLIPYLELDIDTKPLTGLTASPTIKSDLAERSIRDYCQYCGIDTDNLPQGIVQSKIPVRF